MSAFLYKRRYGFTLAEILVVLGVLAIMATFTIPKVLNSIQTKQFNAVLKEDISTLQSITYAGVQDRGLSSNFWNYYASRLNAVKQCDTNSNAQGCFVEASQGGTVQSWNMGNGPGFVMHNGSNMVGYFSGGWQVWWGAGTYVAPILIDANGIAGPNQLGQDQIFLTILYGTGNWTCDDVLCGSFGPRRPGTVGPPGWFEPNSAPLYLQLFSK
jgi:prepilin-type N-terminal cleavage/methylation domain-containing protein